MTEPCILLMLLAVIAVQHGEGATTYVCVAVYYTSFNTSCTYKYDNISYAFESHLKTSDTTFVIQPGNYTLLPVNITFDSINNISILGNVSRDNNVIVNCQPHTGLYFYNSHDININDVSFIGCGATYGSSRNFSLLGSLYNAIYFIQCSNVSIKGVTVANSTGTAIYMQATLGSNVIKGCTFKYNMPSHDSQGSGVAITFPECPRSVARCENNRYSQDQLSYSKYTIYNSTFMNNQANDSQVNISRPDDLDNGRGGGIYIYIGWKAQKNTISVDTCSFEHNTALYGGGAYIGIAQYSKYNNITFTNSRFVNNEAIQGGGGVRIQFQFIVYNIYESVVAHNNQLNFSSCHFAGNSASLGGGVSLYTTNEKNMTNMFSFYDSTFNANIAKTGSAVDMTAWLSFDGSPPQPYFSNCTFYNNIQRMLPLYGVSESSSVGTMYLDSVSVKLVNVNFTNNHGTPIYAINNHLLFLKGSHSTFSKNSGTNGGAIALIGNAAIAVETNVTINFTNNTASVHGGAIYAFVSSQHDDIFSINCFIHSHEPKQTPNIGWQGLLYFRNNTANGRNESIFATTLHYCTWKYQEEDTSFIFCSVSHFDFGPSANCEDEVASLPKQIKASSSSLSVVLGKSTFMPLNVTDDYNKSVDSYVLIATSTSEIEVDKAYQYISNQRVKLTLKNHPLLTNETESIILQTLFPRVLELKVSVKPLPCPPGYWINENIGECQCSEYSFGGNIIRCQSNFSAMIRKGFWIGHYNNVPVVGRCRFCAANLNQKHGGFIELPDSYDRVNDVLCGGKKEGVLCTSCSNNGSFTLNVVSYECIECSSKEFKYTWIYVILTQILPVLVLLLLIIWTNFPLASGYLNGAIFFSQVITTSLDISGDGEIPLENITESADIYLEVFDVIYGIWNLDFIEPAKYCLAPNLTMNSIFAWEYVIALLPFSIVAILCLIHLCNEGRCAGRMERCGAMTIRNIQNICCNINVEFNNKVLTNALSSCILLGYTRCALNTCYILNWTHLYNSSNHIVATVPYFDGSTKFGQGRHILYMSIAFGVAIILIVFPIILLCARHKLDPRTNNKYIKFFNAVLMAFQSDFKDGHMQEEERQRNIQEQAPNNNIPRYYCRPYLCFSDLRWVAGLYLVIRLAMALAFVFSNTFITQVLVQQILAVVMIIVFAILQPYREERHNKIDCCIFLLIIVINSITLYQYSLTVAMEKLSTAAFVIQYILIYVPMLWIALYIANRIKHWCRARCQQPQQPGRENHPLLNGATN